MSATQLYVNGAAVTTANPLPITGGGSGSDPAAGASGAAPNGYANQIGYISAGNLLTAVSTANPLPVTGAGGGGNASASSTGVAPPAYADNVGFTNASGNLTGVSTTNPLPVAIDASNVSLTVTEGSNISLAAGSNLVGAVNVDIGGSTVSPTNAMPMIDGYQAAQSASWTTSTTVNTALTCNTQGFDTVVFTANMASAVGGFLTYEVYDGLNWVGIRAGRIVSFQTDATYPLTGTGIMAWQCNVAGFPQFRIRLSTALTAGTCAVQAIVSSAPADSTVTVGFDATSLSNFGNYGTAPGSIPAMPVNAYITGATGLSVSSTSAALGSSGAGAASALAAAVAPATPVATAIKSSFGRIYKLDIGNSGTTDVWFKVWNVPFGSVVLGTTAPTHDMYVPKGTRQTWDLCDIGDYLAGSGLAYAVQGAIGITTTGITANTVSVNIRYL